MNGIVYTLRAMWRVTLVSLGFLFAPIAFIFRPIARLLGRMLTIFLPGRWLGKRAAWRTTSMAVSSQSLEGGLFKPINTSADFASRAVPQIILRPVNVVFVWFSLLLGLCFNLLPWGSWHWVPDALAIIILFWAYREPRIISLGAAFLLGLPMDVHDGTVLGQHSLSYCILAYGGVLLSRRLPSFGLLTQSLQVWPVLVVSALVSAVVKAFFGVPSSGLWLIIIATMISAILWPLVTWLLLAPQRRPLDIDNNRPL